MFSKAKIENIPKKAIEPIYNELYDKRINAIVGSTDRNLEKYYILINKKHLTEATLIVAKHI